MTTKIFNTVDSELRKYDGQRVEVVRPLTESEADLAEVGPMFKIRFADGYERDAFGDELTSITALDKATDIITESTRTSTDDYPRAAKYAAELLKRLTDAGLQIVDA